MPASPASTSIAEVLKYYDAFPKELQDRLPLKRVWMLQRPA